MSSPEGPTASSDLLDAVAGPEAAARTLLTAAHCGDLAAAVGSHSKALAEAVRPANEALESVQSRLLAIQAKAVVSGSAFEKSLQRVSGAIETASRLSELASASQSACLRDALTSASGTWSSVISSYRTTTFDVLPTRSLRWAPLGPYSLGQHHLFTLHETAHYFGFPSSGPKGWLARRVGEIQDRVDALLSSYEIESPEYRFIATLVGRARRDTRNAPAGAPAACWIAELRRLGRALIRNIPGSKKALLQALDRLLRDAIELGNYLRSLEHHLASTAQVRPPERLFVHHSIARHTRAMTRPAYAW